MLIYRGILTFLALTLFVWAEQPPQTWSDAVVLERLNHMGSSKHVDLDLYLIAQGISQERAKWLEKRLAREHETKFNKLNSYRVKGDR